MNENRNAGAGRRKILRNPLTDSLEIGKVAPQAIDIEAAILGGCMLTGAYVQAASILRAEYFYLNEHRLIFEAMGQLDKLNRPIDILTVCSQLRATGNLDQVGGSYVVSQLTDRVASDANMDYHCMLVLQKALAREQIRVAGDVYNMAFEDTSDPIETMEHMAREVDKLTAIMSLTKTRSTADVADTVLHNAEKASATPSGITGVPTGFSEVDQLTQGRQNTELIIMAARPAMGKTARMLGEALNAALRFDRRVVVFSLEMGAEQLMTRALSILSDVEIHKIKRGNLTEDDWDKLHTAAKRVANPNFRLIDDVFTLQGIKAECRKMRQTSGLDIVYIDYLQLIQVQRQAGQNREQEVSEISRTLKLMAKSLNVPVVALSQLSRAVETRGGSKRPQLSDLRESGAIEQDADVVVFLYRPEYYGHEESHTGLPVDGLCEEIYAKNRGGSLADIPLRFDAALTKFSNYAQPDMGRVEPMSVTQYKQLPHSGEFY